MDVMYKQHPIDYVDSDKVCIICRQTFDNSKKYSIQCDHCSIWYHGECINVPEYLSEEIDKFYCLNCQYKVGPPILKKFTNDHRHNKIDPHADNKPTQSGTPRFVRELKDKHFQDAKEVIKCMRGQQLSLSHFIQNGFDMPIFVQSKDGLDFVLPQENTFSYYSLLQYIDNDYELDVIDVTRQMNTKMTLKQFIDKINVPIQDRTDTYNCISLEVSESPLSKFVSPPNIVKKLCWVENYWPKVDVKPKVQKYCLMSMQDSYTDFHIDFGGTTVWYHILKGEKVFYLIKPTFENLKKYENWMSRSDSSEMFLGDYVDACYKLVICAGQTLFIPTGWIHAVLTVTDSIVFGGNFLHSLNIHLQLEIYQMEHRIKTPKKFTFPYFELTHWYAAPNIFRLIQEHLKEKFPPKYLVIGAKKLLPFLKTWFQQNKSTQNGHLAPNAFDCQKLITDLSRVVKRAERRLDGQPLAKRRKSYQSFHLNPNNSNLQSQLIMQNTQTNQEEPNLITNDNDKNDDGKVGKNDNFNELLTSSNKSEENLKVTRIIKIKIPPKPNVNND